MYNGTFVIRIRWPGAQVEIIFGADSILEQALYRGARRRTGVKMAGGTARDVVSGWSRWRPPNRLTPGSGFQRAVECCFEHAG